MFLELGVPPQMIIGATATINLLDAFAVWQFLGTLKSELTLMGRSNTRGGSTGKGQQSRTDESTKVNTTSRVKCFNYVYGHYAAECRKPRRERERERGQTLEVNLAQTQDDEPTLLFTECKEKKGVVVLLNEESVIPIFAPEGNTDVNSNLWYLDNGASNHMTGRRSKFRNLDEDVTSQVKFSDGSTVKIEGKGSIVLKCKNGEERLLHEVYFIPTLQNNIISPGQLFEAGNKVIMHGDYLWVYDEQDELLMKVKRSSNRLYKIVIEEGTTICLLSKAEETSWLWHSRLGHVNFQAMKLMSSNGMARGIPDFVQPKEVCNGCLFSKQAQKPFPSQTNFVAKEKLELLHGDLCGPISPPTPAGNMYFFSAG